MHVSFPSPPPRRTNNYYCSRRETALYRREDYILVAAVIPVAKTRKGPRLRWRFLTDLVIINALLTHRAAAVVGVVFFLHTYRHNNEFCALTISVYERDDPSGCARVCAVRCSAL